MLKRRKGEREPVKPIRNFMIKPERPAHVNKQAFEELWTYIECSRDIKCFGSLAVATRIMNALITRGSVRSEDLADLRRMFR